jgi:acyl-CoA synthetase (AMP-forming)/AMP-acid ligase II
MGGNMNLNDVLKRQIKIQPDKTFLFFKDDEISYSTFGKRVNSVASALKKEGVKKGERVALFLNNCPEFLYSWFAIARLGAIMVPINVAFKEREASYILDHSEANTLIADLDLYREIIEQKHKDLLHLKSVFCVGDKEYPETISFSRIINEDSDSLPEEQLTGDDVISVIYTSGTTGEPKGCVLSHFHYIAFAEAIKDNLLVTPEDRFICVLPLFHIGAQVVITMTSLISGASLVLIDRFHPRQFWEQAYQHKVTVFHCIGAILAFLDKLRVTEYERNNTLRVALSAGHPELAERLGKRWGCKMLQDWGMSEGGITIEYINGPHKKGSCGKPQGPNEIKIFDKDDREVSTGTVGEIVMRGPMVLKGYYKDPETTSTSMRGGWFHTGDNAYRDKDNFFYFVDRKKDIIRRSGENISSLEVEEVIRSHPKVEEVAVVAFPDELRGEEVKAYIILKEGETHETVLPMGLIQFCEERLAYFKVPRYIVYRKDFPRTLTHRVKKDELRKLREEPGEFYFDRRKTE